MKPPPFLRASGLSALAIVVTLALGCEALRPKATPQPAYYALDPDRVKAAMAAPSPSAGSVAPATLIVNPPHAAAGFDSARIVYLREPHQLEYFAHSEWVDTPARMLGPLIVAAVERGGALRTVVLAPSAAIGDLTLDTGLLRLQQDFGVRPSRVRFTLRATIVDGATRRVLASREFDRSIAATSEDPYGGVAAANNAVQVVLEELARFCGETAGRWRRAKTDAPHPAPE